MCGTKLVRLQGFQGRRQDLVLVSHNRITKLRPRKGADRHSLFSSCHNSTHIVATSGSHYKAGIYRDPLQLWHSLRCRSCSSLSRGELKIRIGSQYQVGFKANMTFDEVDEDRNFITSTLSYPYPCSEFGGVLVANIYDRFKQSRR